VATHTTSSFEPIERSEANITGNKITVIALPNPTPTQLPLFSLASNLIQELSGFCLPLT
jgi:hypothetical protein